MFTIDPASGDHDRLVIEGSLRPRRVGRLGAGLARPLRGRQGDPPHRQARREAQGACDRAAPRRGHPHPRALAARSQRSPSFSDDEVRELAKLGLRDEDHYGTPQDTEWAFDEEGSAWMLQSRPVTASRRRQERRARRARGRGAGTRPWRRSGRRARRGADHLRAQPGQRPRGGRRPRHPHDRPRLGASDAALGGDRHRLRRDDLSRGDRLA